ncbi:MAG: peptidase S10, partial [Xanthobacteraceae bacterium]
MRVSKWLLALALLALGAVAATPLAAQDHAKPEKPAAVATTPPNPLPPEAVTHHVLELPGRMIHFTAEAGAIRLSNAKTGA